jgi:2-C-methyl-D-erythritol 2,4-cyclodiphosphate synthase
VRVGQGYDVHRLVEGRPLVLGGVRIPHERGLEGHSDADVLAHAVADALLGAIGAGDLGAHFPSSEERWRGATGSALLDRVLERVRVSGRVILNVDSTLVAQEPRLAPWREAIATSLCGILHIEASRVNVKLKSRDELGAIGRGEGIEAHAVVLLAEPLLGDVVSENGPGTR